jgi:hypothetical protein
MLLLTVLAGHSARFARPPERNLGIVKRYTFALSGGMMHAETPMFQAEEFRESGLGCGGRSSLQRQIALCHIFYLP